MRQLSKTADSCKGSGIARECKENGGVHLDFAVHMKALWTKIGFSPSQFELPTRVDEDEIVNYKKVK